jgi:hypothetical protein
MFEIDDALNARSEVYLCRVLLLGKGGLTSVSMFVVIANRIA